MKDKKGVFFIYVREIASQGHFLTRALFDLLITGEM